MQRGQRGATALLRLVPSTCQPHFPHRRVESSPCCESEFLCSSCTRCDRSAVGWVGNCSSDDHRWLSADGRHSTAREEGREKYSIEYSVKNNLRFIYLLLRDVNGRCKINPGDLLTARRCGQRTSVAKVTLHGLRDVLAQWKWIGHVNALAFAVNMREQVGKALIATSWFIAHLMEYISV